VGFDPAKTKARREKKANKTKRRSCVTERVDVHALYNLHPIDRSRPLTARPGTTQVAPRRGGDHDEVLWRANFVYTF